ncbi:hypothetical protein BJF79_06145 [Actinomadura sp. CNU-125]|nr:hypothetical protein BJF79_06145 [Actinomadura sp. CNU-125]
MTPVTSVPSVMFSVSAAAYDSAEYASSIGSSGGPTMSIWKKWSMTHSEWSPAWSASRAMPPNVGPICSGPPGKVKLGT